MAQSFALAAALLCSPVMAQIKPTAEPVAAVRPAPSGPPWASLSAEQRAALAPLQRDWPGIDELRKAKWLELAQRFHKMPVDEQQRVQQRMAEWARMSPLQRGRARLNFQESKQFSPEEKQEHWQSYQALPADQRKALANAPRPDNSVAKPAALAPLASESGSKNAARLVKPVSPTVVQGKPGATTTLMTQTPQARPEQRPGQPVIAAKPDQVDRTTLLPKRGPQAANPASSASSP